LRKDLISLLEERDVSVGSLPVGNISANELQIRVLNKDRMYDAGNPNSPFRNLVKPNRIVRAWLGCKVDGSIEWIPLGKFHSGDWNVPEDGLYAETSAVDLMEDLAKKKYTTSGVLQNVTLYDLAKDILEDYGLSEVDGEFWIDTELDGADYTIPYAYLDNITYREALRLVVEAGMGQAYIDRNGVLRVEGPSFLDSITDPSKTIGLDKIYSKNIPSRYESVKNKIIVKTQPFKPTVSKEDVYTSTEGITVGAESEKTVTVFYTSKPVMEAEALIEDAPTGCSVKSATYYAWGAVVKLENTDTSEHDVYLYVKGKPLKVVEPEEVVAEDSTSITENGVLEYEFAENHFVQSKTLAQKIANKLLEVYKEPRRDLDMEWRGDPALELTDLIRTYDYKDETEADFYIVQQNLEYDGVLRATMKGRRKSA